MTWIRHPRFRSRNLVGSFREPAVITAKSTNPFGKCRHALPRRFQRTTHTAIRRSGVMVFHHAFMSPSRLYESASGRGSRVSSSCIALAAGLPW